MISKFIYIQKCMISIPVANIFINQCLIHHHFFSLAFTLSTTMRVHVTASRANSKSSPLSCEWLGHIHILEHLGGTEVD